jgi:hypothetical protein
MILVDQRIGTYILPYEDLSHITFHMADEQWVEFVYHEDKQHLIPGNMLCEGVVLLKVNS